MDAGDDLVTDPSNLTWFQLLEWRLMPHHGGPRPPKHRCLYAWHGGVNIAVGFFSGSDDCIYVKNADGTNTKVPLERFDQWTELGMVPDERMEDTYEDHELSEEHESDRGGLSPNEESGQ